MRSIVFSLVTVVCLAFGSAPAEAAVFRFDSDPFAGNTALTTPGRQIVGGEASISFSPDTDLFSLASEVFGVGTSVNFFNGLGADVPDTGRNVIVLQDDTVPFAAGTAANLIASRVTTPGAGFFIYFNSGLDLPRLVFSTDLSSDQADLKILFRMTNLAGAAGRAQLPAFSTENFEITAVPEPATLLLAALGLAAAARRRFSGAA